MKPLLILLVAISIAGSLGCAAPLGNFTSRECIIHSVITTADTITMIVSGYCNFSVMQEKSQSGGWRGRAITTLMDRTRITFSRKSYEDAQEATRQNQAPSWDEISSKVKEFEGKTVKIMLVSETQVFRRGRLVDVSGENMYIY